MKNVETLKPYELIEELEKWAGCYSDAKDNYDARLLKRAAVVIEDLLDEISRGVDNDCTDVTETCFGNIQTKEG